MSSHDDDRPDNRVPQKLIYHAQQRVQLARSEMWRALFESGYVPEDIRTELQTAVMLYYDELRKYKDRPQAEAVWSEKGPWEDGLNELERRATQPSVSVTETTGPRQRQAERSEGPPRLSAGELYDASKALDDVAEALGFAADTPMPEEVTEPI